MLIAVPVGASLKTIISDWFDFYIKDKYEKFKSENEHEKLSRDKIVSAFDLSDKPNNPAKDMTDNVSEDISEDKLTPEDMAAK